MSEQVQEVGLTGIAIVSTIWPVRAIKSGRIYTGKITNILLKTDK